MFLIGDLSALTGLSVKALRHYDEQRVLVPDEVDPVSGYRRYGPGQVRAAVVVAAMREAGVPLPAVAAALAGDDVTGALAARAERVAAERAEEDAAAARAAETIAALDVEVPVEERVAPAQPYVATVFGLGADGAGAPDDDAANAAFAALFEALQRDGLGPAGAFWTALRVDGRTEASLRCCWPVARRPETGWGGGDVVVDELPDRVELVASAPADADPVDGALSPAVVALFDAVAARGGSPRFQELRQAIVQDERGTRVEVAVTVDAPGR